MSQWGHGPQHGWPQQQSGWGYGPPGYPPPVQQGPRCPICGYVGRLATVKKRERNIGLIIVMAIIFFPIALIMAIVGQRTSRATQCPKCRTVLGGWS